ncbi:uncharacterized protein LOC128201999 [Galleria mellonella]|uniref:Uncharacterized protein LOC128201999 n=1 Tax=Galleria mellonella TaxID=7137 RepID=A0ABM3MZD2_GALME|nr:uncharacterized protein LOC128201999 [Galleria mellonella]
MRMASRKTEFPRAVPSGDGESATTAPVQPGVVSPVYLGGATEGQSGVGDVVMEEVVMEAGLATTVVPVRASRSLEVDPATDEELASLAGEIDSMLSRSTSMASLFSGDESGLLERPRSRRKRRISETDDGSATGSGCDTQSAAKKASAAKKSAKSANRRSQFCVSLYEGGNTVPPNTSELEKTLLSASSGKGRGTGLAKAKADLAAAKNRNLEREVAPAVAGSSRMSVHSEFKKPPQPGGQFTDPLEAEMDGYVSHISETVRKCGNIKGTIIKEIKSSLTGIRIVTEKMLERGTSAEYVELRKENARLATEMANQRVRMDGMLEEAIKDRKEMKALRMALSSSGGDQSANTSAYSELQRELELVRKENAELAEQYVADRRELRRLRQELEEAKKATQPPSASAAAERAPAAPAPLQPGAVPSEEEGMEARIVRQIGDIFSARFAIIEERLGQVGGPKPPRKRKNRKRASQPPTNRDVEEDPKRNGPPRQPAKATETGADAAPLPSTSNMSEGWSTVVRRGKRPKATKPQADPARQTAPKEAAPAKQLAGKKKKGRRRRFRQPKSHAVVLTLLPEAEERGFTYKDVFRRYRLGVTQARILEVPGADSGDKADLLATRLTEILPEGIVKISRPMKTAELRIGDLDDSVVPADVVAAVAREGGCGEASVSTGEIRRSPSGAGTIWVRCPVGAARTLAKAGRIKIGWVMARVQPLDPRPLRCYRCLLLGHVAQRCTARVDTGGGVLCFRCGQAGHKSANCEAPSPRCGVCAAAGRKADHRVGGTAKCSQPRKARASARDGRGGGGGWRESSGAQKRQEIRESERCVFPALHSRGPMGQRRWWYG